MCEDVEFEEKELVGLLWEELELEDNELLDLVEWVELDVVR